MSGTRQKIQSELALEPKGRGEPPGCGRQGSEPPVAKPTPENPASAEQSMEEICDRENSKQRGNAFEGTKVVRALMG